MADIQVQATASSSYQGKARINVQVTGTWAQTKTTSLLSYDTDFDDFPFITREEPQPLKQAA